MAEESKKQIQQGWRLEKIGNTGVANWNQIKKAISKLQEGQVILQFNTGPKPTCPYGCDSIDNTQHLLKECTAKKCKELMKKHLGNEHPALTVLTTNKIGVIQYLKELGIYDQTYKQRQTQEARKALIEEELTEEQIAEASI